MRSLTEVSEMNLSKARSLSSVHDSFDIPLNAKCCLNVSLWKKKNDYREL